MFEYLSSRIDSDVSSFNNLRSNIVQKLNSFGFLIPLDDGENFIRFDEIRNYIQRKVDVMQMKLYVRPQTYVDEVGATWYKIYLNKVFHDFGDMTIYWDYDNNRSTSSVISNDFPNPTDQIYHTYNDNSIKTISLYSPSNQKNIANTAFAGVNYILSAIISPAIHTLKQESFNGCENLDYVDFSNVKVVETGVFTDVNPSKIYNFDSIEKLYNAFSTFTRNSFGQTENSNLKSLVGGSVLFFSNVADNMDTFYIPKDCKLEDYYENQILPSNIGFLYKEDIVNPLGLCTPKVKVSDENKWYMNGNFGEVYLRSGEGTAYPPIALLSFPVYSENSQILKIDNPDRFNIPESVKYIMAGSLKVNNTGIGVENSFFVIPKNVEYVHPNAFLGGWVQNMNLSVENGNKYYRMTDNGEVVTYSQSTYQKISNDIDVQCNYLSNFDCILYRNCITEDFYEVDEKYKTIYDFNGNTGEMAFFSHCYNYGNNGVLSVKLNDIMDFGQSAYRFFRTAKKAFITNQTNTLYSSYERCLYSKDQKTLIKVPNQIDNFKISLNCEQIMNCAFYSCTSESINTLNLSNIKGSTYDPFEDSYVYNAKFGNELTTYYDYQTYVSTLVIGDDHNSKLKSFSDERNYCQCGKRDIVLFSEYVHYGLEPTEMNQKVTDTDFHIPFYKYGMPKTEANRTNTYNYFISLLISETRNGQRMRIVDIYKEDNITVSDSVNSILSKFST